MVNQSIDWALRVMPDHPMSGAILTTLLLALVALAVTQALFWVVQCWEFLHG